MVVGIPGSEFDPMNGLGDRHLCTGAIQIGDASSEYQSPVISVISASVHADTFFTLTALGKVTAHTLRNEVFEQLVKHRYDSSTAQKVETAVYCRQLNKALGLLVKVVREPRAPRTYIAPNEEELIEMCTMKPAISEESWSIASKAADPRKMMDQFQTDLQEFGSSIPPGFDNFPQWKKSIRNFSMEQFKLLVLRLKIVKCLNNGDWQFILDNEEAIVKGMELDPAFIDLDTFTYIIETILVNFHIKALALGLKIGSLLSDVPNFEFSSLASLMGMLIFPTIYESTEWLPTRDAIRVRKEDRQSQVNSYITKSNALKNEQGMGTPTALSESQLKGKRRGRMAIQMNSNSQSDALDFELIEKRNQLIYPTLCDSKILLPMISLEMYN